MEPNLPDNMNYCEGEDELIIERNWPRSSAIIIAVVSIVFTFVTYYNGFSFSFYILLPLAILAGGIYTTVGFLRNKTYITVNKDGIDVRHAPIPWMGNQFVARSEIDQLFSKETISRGNEQSSVSYSVSIKGRNFRDKTLISGLYSLEEAIYIEKKIEIFLGIEDDFHFESPDQITTY